MIFDVNLLASARGPGRVKTSVLTAGAVAVSIVLLGLTAWSYVLIEHVNVIRRDLAQATQELAQLRPVARHAQELQRTAERIRLRRDLLQRLPATQMSASVILGTIRSVIPHDVSLTSVTAGTSDVTLEGYTPSYPSVARFMVELQASGTVRHIDLASSQRESVNGSDVVKFRMTAELTGMHPVASQKEGLP